jgi:small subunit ribosomal protein S8
MTDPIADMLTRIRNGHGGLAQEVEMPHSRIKEHIASLLKREGYIDSFTVAGTPPKRTLKIKLKYQGRRAVIDGIRRISSPGLRRYFAASDIPRVRGGLGTAILSTSQGIMTGGEARKKNVGGELLCYVW